MNKELVIKIMKQYNSWRRGKIDEFEYSPKEVGVAIDYIIKYLEDDNNKEIKS